MRTLTLEANPLPPETILGLREKFASSKIDADGIEIEYDHTLGYGALVLAITVRFPDGRDVTETVKLSPMLKQWAVEIISERQADDAKKKKKEKP